MRDEFADIIKSLRIEEESLARMSQRVLNTCTSETNTEQIIKELEEEKQRAAKIFILKTYFSLFQACAYAELYRWPEAVKCVDEALGGFDILNITKEWDRGMAHWIRGIIYFGANRQEDCCEELRNAVAILKWIAEDSERTGRYENRERCHEFLLNRLDWILTRLPDFIWRSAPSTPGQLGTGEPAPESPFRPSPPPSWPTETKEEPYQVLLNMAKGEVNLSERLIAFEIEREPTISRNEALDRAIQRWIDDNR